MATINITARVITLGNRIIQISNITEASLSRDNSYRSGKIKALIGAVVIAIATLALPYYLPAIDRIWLYAGCGLVGALCVVAFCLRPTYELNILTNAGSMVPLSSKNGAMIREVLAEIEAAMQKKDLRQNRTIDIGNAAVQLRFIESVID